MYRHSRSHQYLNNGRASVFRADAAARLLFLFATPRFRNLYVRLKLLFKIQTTFVQTVGFHVSIRNFAVLFAE